MSNIGRAIGSTIVEVNRRVGEVTDKINRERGQVLDLEATAPGTIRIPHKLGKAPSYFLVISKNATCDIWRDDDDRWDATSVIFRVSAAVNAKVRVW